MISKRKRAAFIAVIVIGVLMIAELASLVSIMLVHGSIRQITKHRRHIAGRDSAAPFRPKQMPGMIHPFIGTVMQPRNDGGKLTIDEKFRITEFGFVDDASPIHRRSPDQVIVAILGGSVACQMSMNASAVLEQELRKSSRFAGKSFRFVRLAMNGFKQPQQLMTISYLMLQGAEFDLVVNLDGVNEAALPQIDNFPFGVSAAYPRKWNVMIAGAGNMRLSRMVGLVTYLREQQRDSAIAFDSFPWKHSMTCCLLWKARHDRLEKTIRQQGDLIAELAETELSYCASGPPETFETDRQLFEHCADVWYRSSVLLRAVCQQHGTEYFHFLQPNQYAPGSQPKADYAINQHSPFRIPVQECYPIMRAKSDAFRSAGVTFTDLTQVFAKHSQKVYIDDCCHVTPTGDEAMATAIATRIREQFDSNPSSPR